MTRRTAQSEDNPRDSGSTAAALASAFDESHEASGLGVQTIRNRSAQPEAQFGDSVAWNPETTKGVNAVGERAYHALEDQFDRAVPSAADMNQRISRLISSGSARNRPSRVPLSHRRQFDVWPHTPRRASGLAGEYSGRREGGNPGTLAGGVARFFVLELLTSRTAK